MSVETKAQSIAMIGLGRVGLPLSLVFADLGFEVHGLDVDAELIGRLQAGTMPFAEVGGEELLRKHVGTAFLPSADPAAVAGCDNIILTLGTPVDENMNPDLSQIDRAIDEVSAGLRPGQTLILRSTVSPGTTRWVLAKLEDELGLKVGQDIFLAFCPERIAEGRALEELGKIPQIVGGIDAESTRRAAALFAHLGVDCLETDDVSAELAKLFTNMYRYISFAVANEFMIIAGQWKRDINHIVNLVNHGYKRGGLALPGLTAGPCLFKDGFFLVNQIPFNELITTAWKINESVPLFLVAALKDQVVLRNKKAVILGAAFKANSDDSRESLSFKVRKALLRERAEVLIHDPHIVEFNGDVETILTGADLVFVATNHDEYTQITLDMMRNIVGKDCTVCDIWNIFGTDRTIFGLEDALTRRDRRGVEAAAPG